MRLMNSDGSGGGGRVDKKENKKICTKQKQGNIKKYVQLTRHTTTVV